MTDFPFDVVVFDLDGTLADTAPDLTAALNHSLVELGRTPVSQASVREMVGHGARALLQRGLAATGEMDPALVDRGFPIFLDYYYAHICEGTVPYPGVEAAMDALAQIGVRLSVCTNKVEGLSVKLLEALGWTDRFASLIGGDTLPVRKPDAAPLLAAIERAGGGKAVMIGDSTSDTGAAAAAAIPSVAVSFGFADRPPHELGATAVIDHFDELIPTLRRIGGI